jgi:outer membrane protein assembly factor BamA
VWSLRATIHNLLGGGRRLAVFSERRSRNHNELTIDYHQPHRALGRGFIDARLMTRDFRDSYSEFSAAGSYGLYLRPELRTEASIGWGTVALVGERPGYRRWQAGFSAVRDTRDRQFNPGRGEYIRWTIEYVRREYTEDTLSAFSADRTLNETRLRIRSSWMLPVARPLILMIAANYDGLETEEQLPPLAELTLVGGPPTLRGFRSEQFAAVRTAYGGIEPRLRFENSFLFAFVDGAYLNNRVSAGESVATEESYEYGYGLGLGISDEHRSLKLSLAWNPGIAFNQPRLAIELHSDF